MKIQTLKLHQAIRVGSEEEGATFFDASKGWGIQIHAGGMIQITGRKGTVVLTTIYNVLWCTPVADDSEAKPAAKARA